ncbi:uvrD_C_2 domain-containing protein [Trichonephila clavipes]|nr:uvrD_C_2 domain-containing protein [Trichonephila clavipes]
MQNKLCGRKRATKSRNLSIRLNLDDDAVSITPHISSIPLNNNKIIIRKRKHFPLISALAMAIHKSLGGTYNAIVYEYDRKHPRELVYVALTRGIKVYFWLIKKILAAAGNFGLVEQEHL